MAWDDPPTRRTRRHEHGRRRLAAGLRSVDPLAGHARPHDAPARRRRGRAGAGRDRGLGRAAARAAGRRRAVGGQRLVPRLDGHDARAPAAAAAGPRPRRARRPGGRSSACATTSPGEGGYRRTLAAVLPRRGRAVHQRRRRRGRRLLRPGRAARWSTGCSASSSPTAAGTARRRTARRCRRSAPRSASSKACWSTSGRSGESGGGPGRPPPRAGVPARAAAVPSQVDGRGDRRRTWLRFAFPTWWLLRRAARPRLPARGVGANPNRASPRRSRSSSGTAGPTADGRSSGARGEAHLELDEGEGKPSRWNTLRALRVLDWAGAGGGAVQATGRTAQEVEA